MGFLSFGSKKKKVMEMLMNNQLEMVVEEAVRDKKTFEALIELLNEKNPGIVGDALLVLAEVMDRKPELLKGMISREYIEKLFKLVGSKNPYVRENAMLFVYEVVKRYPETLREFHDEIIKTTKELFQIANKDEIGFLITIIGELKLREVRHLVEEFVGVEDKVVLPFEGKKWVSLDQIARETLEKL